MRRYHLQLTLRVTRLPALEVGSLVAGVALIGIGVVTMFALGGPGGPARAIGSLGLCGVATWAALRGLRLYSAAATAELPTSVARVHVRTRPARALSAITVALALVLPIGAALTLLALFYWAWPFVAGVLLLGCAAARATSRREGDELQYYMDSGGTPTALLERLCMRADIPVPDFAVEHAPMANAWTTGGRVHVSRRLVELLDDGELEAVLAHEVAHLARRDAAVMEICSAPSRVLLGFANLTPRRFWRWMVSAAEFTASLPIGIAILALLCVPPAFVIGWVSRLSVLMMSRAREHSADAAAATLTGRPSALASALLKLENQRDRVPRTDLRQVEAYAMLCIVGTARGGLRRLLSTHPSTAARVKRLAEIEGRMQGPAYSH